jgi:hypothetical protein
MLDNLSKLNLYTLLVQCICLLLSFLVSPILSAPQFNKDINTDDNDDNWPISVKGKYNDTVVRRPNPDADEN